MGFVVEIHDPDGTPWINETGDSKQQVIDKLRARARTATTPSARTRIDDAIRRLESSS